MKSEQYDEFLQNELSWRKKEISDLFFLAQRNNNEVLLKSLILILYAHWEGYIKKSSKLYLKYVVEEKVKIQDLTLNFKAITLKNIAKNCMKNNESLTLTNELQLLNKYSSIDNKKFKININPLDDKEKNVISTEHNLKPKVLKNIFEIIGCRYNAALKQRENYINNNLLSNRNAIGHGSQFDASNQEDFSLSIEDIAKLKEFVITILDFYTEILIDYKEKKFYLNGNKISKNVYDEEKELQLAQILKDLEDE